MGPISVEYCDKLDAFTEDFYIAEITFSDLYLIYYPNIMSGSPNSVVNIKSIGEYSPVTFAELAEMYSHETAASDGLKAEIGELLEKNREFYEMFVWGEGYELGEPARDSIYPVTFMNYAGFGEFRDALNSVYTGYYADRLLNNFNGSGSSFREDENGDTYVDIISVFGAGGSNAFRYGKDSYTYRITRVNADVCEFDISYRLWNGYGINAEGIPDGDDTIVTRHVKAVKENGEWRLPYMVCFDDKEDAR